MSRYREPSAFRNSYGKVNLSKDDSSLTVVEDKAILTSEQSSKLQKKSFLDTELGIAAGYVIAISSMIIGILGLVLMGCETIQNLL